MTVLFDRVGYKELRTAFMTYRHLLTPESEPGGLADEPMRSRSDSA
jgi:hypothetical protein